MDQNQDLEKNLIPSSDSKALEIEEKKPEVKEDPIPKPKTDLNWVTLPHFNTLKNYEPTIEFDTYLLSAILSGLFIPISIFYVLIESLLLFFFALVALVLPFAICCFWICGDYFKFFLSFLRVLVSLVVLIALMYLLILPGIFVVILQICSIQFLEDIPNVDIIPYDSLLFMKIGIVIIYICMVSTELSQGINTFLYIISLTKKVLGKDTCQGFFAILCLAMPVMQILTVCWLCKISLMVILNAGSVLDLVQNFAGLYVILEFDNIMFGFINLFPWRTYLQIIIHVEILGISVNKHTNDFICIFWKELLNLPDVSEVKSKENQEEKFKEKEDKTEKEDLQGKKIEINEEKPINEVHKVDSEKVVVDVAEKPKTTSLNLVDIHPGEDQEDFKFSYQDAFGDKAKYLVILKMLLMFGMICFWMIYYVICKIA